MAWRFRKSIRIAPGLRINLGKRGASLSVGGKGITTTYGNKGTRTTVSLPGTGLSYSHYQKKSQTPPQTTPPTSGAATPKVFGWLIVVGLIVLAVLLVGG